MTSPVPCRLSGNPLDSTRCLRRALTGAPTAALPDGGVERHIHSGISVTGNVAARSSGPVYIPSKDRAAAWSASLVSAAASAADTVDSGTRLLR